MSLSVLAPFTISGIAFILAYLSVRIDESYLTLMFFGTGLFLSIAGVVLLARVKD